MPGRLAPILVVTSWLLLTAIAGHETWTQWTASRILVTPERIYAHPDALETRRMRFVVGEREIGTLTSVPTLVGNESLILRYAVTADTSNLSLFKNMPFFRRIRLASTRLDIQGEVFYDVTRAHKFLAADFSLQLNETRGHLFAERFHNTTGDEVLKIRILWPGAGGEYTIPWEQCPLISLDPLASLSVPWLQKGTRWVFSTFDFMTGRDFRFIAEAQDVELVPFRGTEVVAWKVHVEDERGFALAKAWVTPEGRLLRCVYVGLLTIEWI